ncbi:MAG: DUF933 domain-containing protein [Deltaproteobacteria bacterium]|jgi:ribosome-binding ATPase YchF (GTP1/OBG family)|nr:DUF933 domain-containing protein [Deltaproteobacteria bacterium]
MKICLIGAPQSGRETVFRALTGQGQSPVHQDMRQGEAIVQDERLDYLTALFKPRKHTPARVDLYLPKPLGEPNEVLKLCLEKARDADVLLMVVGAFPNLESSNLIERVSSLASELLVSDYLTVSKRLERLAEEKKRGRKNDPEEALLLEIAFTQLEAEKPLRDLREIVKSPKLRGFGLLSAKPIMVLVNLADDGDENSVPPLPLPSLALRGRLEEELRQLSPQEAQEFMADYGVKELIAERVVKTLYDLMDLVSFFTVGEDECRAWTMPNGESALYAAGQIHSDIQKGFIRAEVVAFEDFKASGGFNEAKKKGVFRLEGKTYAVADGDIVHFRFNV